MNKISPSICLFFFLIVISPSLCGQGFDAEIRLADLRLEQGDYSGVLQIYEKWLPQVKKELGENDTILYYRILERAAVCCYHSGQYDMGIGYAKEMCGSIN